MEEAEADVEKVEVEQPEVTEIVEEKEPDAPSNPLTSELIAQHISLLARTGNGLSHAYTRLEIHDKKLTDIDVLENYVHLRYIVSFMYFM
jgi:hypothetical protein